MEFKEIQGEKIPAIGLGTAGLKGARGVNAVQTALELGYRHLDTAQIYDNEEEIGKAIEDSDVPRDEIWITTKIWRDEMVENSIDYSMEKLRTDYLDMVLIHRPHPRLDLEMALDQLAKLVEKGKIRNMGISNFDARQMQKAIEISRKPLLTNQVGYNPFVQPEKIRGKCVSKDQLLTAYSPLARGEIAGNELLKEIGERYDKTEFQVSLRWLVQKENTVAIPKAASKKHQKENLDIFDFELDQREIEQIDALNSE